MFRNKNSYWFTLFAVLIIFLSLFLRTYSPESDLPPDISISGSVYTDEGNQCHNSRSKVLYGDWFPDNWKITNYNPVVPYLKLIIFKLFGIGLVQVRSVSYIFALLSLIFFYLTLRSYFSSILSIAGIILLGFNFLYIMYNRIGTFETPMIFWMVLTLYFLEKFRVRGKYIYPFLSGIFAFMAFVFKMTGAHIIPVPVFSLVLFLLFFKDDAITDKKNIVKSILFVCSAIVVSFLIWLVFFYIPNEEWIKSAPGSYIGNQMFPKSIDQLVGNIVSYNWKDQFYKMWIVWSASLLYFPLFFRRLFLKLTDITEIGYVLFLLSHTGALMIMNHRPTRYLIAAIPPMVFLTILFFRHITSDKEVTGSGRVLKSVFFIFDIVWLFFSLYYCFIPLLSRINLNFFPVKFSFRLFFISIGLVVISRLVFGFFPSKKQIKLYLKRATVPLVVVFVLLSLTFNMKYYYLWERDKTDYVYKISNELGKKVKNGYIAGLTAPVAVLENRHKSLFLYPNFVHWGKETLVKYGITHALLASFNFEITNFFKQWPEIMKRARLLKVYNVKEQFLHLYSFTDPVIKDIRRINGENLLISIINPGNSKNAVIGKIEFRDKGNDILGEKFTKVYIKEPIYLKKGDNSIEIKDIFNGREKLFFIDNKEWGNRFRYEAEKFPRKRGRVIRDISASGKHLRFFDTVKDRSGFMICSNSGKFIPFSSGFMEVRFYLKFKNIKSRIRPLAVVDIYDNTDKTVATSLIIKNKNVEGDGFNIYPVRLKIRSLKDLEFRVFAEKTADIYVDYIELDYYQGKFTDKK